MGFIIEDGTGAGFSAKVDSNSRLYTDAVARVVEEDSATKGEAFIFHGECSLSAAPSGGLMAITNDSTTHNIVITRIYIDAHTLDVPVILAQVKRPTTFTGGTDISATGIINKLFDSGKTSSATLIISDSASDMVYTGGEKYHAPFIESRSSHQRDMAGTNIVTPGTTLLFGWKTEDGANAVDGNIVSLSVNMHRELRDI